MTLAVHPRSAAASPRQTGMTLIEVLVAFAVFVIVAAAAFIIFSRMRQAEKIGQQAVDQQQVLRISFFDELVPQLRKAGLNHNPEGNKQLDDEQIEGAWAGAVMFRADLDQDDPTESADPESVIEGPWNAVSIGNDEIIMYALMEPGGGGGSTVQINADVHSATTTTSPGGTTVAERDDSQETLNIPNIVTAQTSPPYTLYRITLNNDATTWGSADFIQRVPVADNIMSLNFTYLDAVGNVITPPGGAETDADIAARKSIKQIQVDMVALTEDPDIFYTDPNDPDPSTQNFRKFTLSSTVQPRNLGRARVADIDLTPPTTPTNLNACAGHCEGMIVSWDPNPVNQGVAEYRVRYGVNPTSLTASRETASTWMYLPDLADATSYYFQVTAKDAAGNQSPYSNSVIEISRDDVAPTRTTPQVVTGAAATGDGTTPPEDQQITVTWNPVGSNVESLACDPQAPSLRDLDRYEYEKAGGAAVPVALSATPTLVDTDVIACRTYGYDLYAVDKCGHRSATPASVYGSATSTVAPEKPIGVNAVYTGPGNVALTWNEVNQDTGGTPAAYDTYDVYRQTIPVASTPDFATAILVGYGITDSVLGDNQVAWADTMAPVRTASTTTWYWVLARDDCPNTSVPSDPAEAFCAFTGTVTLSPGDGTSMPTGTIAILVNASGDTFTGSKLSIFDDTGTEVFAQSQTGPEPWSYTWAGTQAGRFRTEAQVQTAGGCAGSDAARWKLIQLVGCADVQVRGVATSNGGKQVIYNFVNRSSSDISLTALNLVWDNANAGGGERLGAVDVGPNPTTLFGGSGTVSPELVPVSPNVTVPALGSVQILYDFTRDMTGNRLTTRFDFDTVGLGSSAQQCNFQILP